MTVPIVLLSVLLSSLFIIYFSYGSILSISKINQSFLNKLVDMIICLGRIALVINATANRRTENARLRRTYNYWVLESEP
jgi:hypothetical protein